MSVDRTGPSSGTRNNSLRPRSMPTSQRALRKIDRRYKYITLARGNPTRSRLFHEVDTRDAPNTHKRSGVRVWCSAVCPLRAALGWACDAAVEDEVGVGVRARGLTKLSDAARDSAAMPKRRCAMITLGAMILAWMCAITRRATDRGAADRQPGSMASIYLHCMYLVSREQLYVYAYSSR